MALKDLFGDDEVIAKYRNMPKNFMTPRVISTTRIRDFVIELSDGRVDIQEPKMLYGVSVHKYIPGRKPHPFESSSQLSKAFYHETEAKKYADVVATCLHTKDNEAEIEKCVTEGFSK